MPLTRHDGPCARSQDKAELQRSICSGNEYCEWSYQYLAGGSQGQVYRNLYRNTALKLAPVTCSDCVSEAPERLQRCMSTDVCSRERRLFA